MTNVYLEIIEHPLHCKSNVVVALIINSRHFVHGLKKIFAQSSAINTPCGVC